MTIIRKAKSIEVDWVNQQYEMVSFKPSNFETETIAIAEKDQQKIGIGRLVQLSDKCFELGGIFVFEKFRGLGVARDIVEFLKLEAPSESMIYCLPFKKLDGFYKSCGFKEINTQTIIPKTIRVKFNWSNQFYTQEVSLLFLKKATPL